MNKIINYTAFATLILFCLNIELQAQTKARFMIVDSLAGIHHQFEVYEGFLGGGACVFDLNNDGFEDIFLTGGMGIDRLYLNLGNGTFKDIYESSGLKVTAKYVTQGVASADVNRDGFTDLFITTNTRKGEKLTIPRAENLLFLNNGDNTFTDATKAFGLSDFMSFSTGVAFGDVNKDGYPDAYIGNYFYEYSGPLNEINDQTIVNASSVAHGYLLINEGGKRFVNLYEKYGLNHKGFGFGGVFTDFDNDGDQDLLVNHDFGYKATPNYLLQNMYPETHFKYVEEERGMDLRINAMTSAVGDYNNDGLLDYFTTNIKFNQFMVNQGDRFNDLADSLGTKLFTISWGANFCDFDQDGDLDLFVANGDLNPNCTPMYNYFFEQTDGKYTDVAGLIGMNDYGIGRGSVIFDYDNDGDQDLLLVNQKSVSNYPVPSVSHLYRNDSTIGNWLKVKLKGGYSETNGIGSRVAVFVGGKSHIREIDGGGSSHLSQSSTTAHIGLGAFAAADSVVVSWPSGERTVIKDVTANQTLVVQEEKQMELKNSNGFKSWYVLLGLFLTGLVAYYIYSKDERKI